MHRIFFEERIGVKILKIVGMVIAGIIFACLMAFLFGYLLQILWNWLMPEIFGLGTITYWQGFGLFLLAKFLFGGFKGHDHRNKKEKDHLQWLKHKSFKNWSPSKLKRFFNYWDDEGEAAFEGYLKQEKEEQTKEEDQTKK